jgi:thymidine kinase
MVKVIYGTKGAGKTKTLIDTANQLVEESTGDVVFIDDSNQLMYDLKHKIRFINISEFPVSCSRGFAGFICGLIAEDYDINGIFIDGLTYILKQKIETLQELFEDIKEISKKYNIMFYFSINGDPETMPEFLKEFIA